MSNVLTFPLGPLEGVLSGIGDELNELGGVRLTRLALDGTEGDTTITVETTHNWADAGTIFIAGRRYSYSGKTASPDTFTGLQEIRNGQPTSFTGLYENLRAYTPVADGNKAFSGVDIAQNMLFVDTAEGAFLDVIGRNYGLERAIGFTDDQYRAMIQVLAYLPRGTVYAIEQVLEAIVGAGQYTVFEDLVNFPNCVFVTLAGALATSASGASYFNQKEEVTSSTSSTLTISQSPIAGTNDNVYGVFLQPDEHQSDMNQLPSADPTTAWTYGGSEVEGTAVTVDSSGEFININDSTGNNAFYRRDVFAEEETDFYASFVVGNPTSSNDGLQMRFHDGTKGVAVGWDATDVFLFDVGGGSRIGTAVTHNGAAITTYRFEKDYVNDSVRLWQNGVLIIEIPYSSLTNTATSARIEWGALYGVGTASADFYDFNAIFIDTRHNYWNEYQPGDASLSSGDPDRVTSGGSNFVQASDVARRVRITGSTAAHGRANGVYLITAVDAGGAWADVQGVPHSATSGAEPLDVLSSEIVRTDRTWDVFTAEDCGVQATLTTGSGSTAIVWTARHGGADGNNITVQIIHAAPASVQVAVVDDGDGPEDIEVTIDPALHTAADVVAAVNGQGDSANLLTASLGGSGSGNPGVVAATNLAGGEDGKFLTISGSVLGNNGSYDMTLVDELNVLLGTHRSPPGLSVEGDLDWRKDPNFPTDAGVTWEVIAAGAVAGLNLTTRRLMPAANTPVYVLYTTQLSAQILLNEFRENNPVGTYYPFYLKDPFAVVRSFVDDVTVAGVIPKYQE